MKYLLALISEEGGMEDASPEEMKAVMDAWSAYSQNAVDNGAFLAGEGLQPSATASTVRFKEGNEPTITDGPFAESKEAVGGYLLLQANDLNEAVAIAKSNPTLDYGITVEVRPVLEECPVFQRAKERIALAVA